MSGVRVPHRRPPNSLSIIGKAQTEQKYQLGTNADLYHCVSFDEKSSPSNEKRPSEEGRCLALASVLVQSIFPGLSRLGKPLGQSLALGAYTYAATAATAG